MSALMSQPIDEINPLFASGRFCHGKTRKNTERFRAFRVIPWLLIIPIL
jgi:hypothetical protein